MAWALQGAPLFFILCGLIRNGNWRESALVEGYRAFTAHFLLVCVWGPEGSYRDQIIIIFSHTWPVVLMQDRAHSPEWTETKPYTEKRVLWQRVKKEFSTH